MLVRALGLYINCLLGTSLAEVAKGDVTTSSYIGGCAKEGTLPGLSLLQHAAAGLQGASLFREAAGVQRVRPSVKTPSTPKHYVHIQYFLDKECTQPEGATQEHSAEDDFCLLGWNFTCGCSDDAKIVLASRYTPSCTSRDVTDEFAAPVGRCVPASRFGGGGNIYMLINDFGSCSCCGSSCTIYGDPHIRVFDNREVSLLKVHEDGVWAGDDQFRDGVYWIVKSKRISIQGRYEKVHYPNAKYGEHTYLTGIAVSGTFMDSNTLVINPEEGKVKWRSSLGHTEDILMNPGVFKVGDLIEAHFRTQMPLVRDSSSRSLAAGLYIHLPSGVKMQVNRFKKHLDLELTMRKEVAGEGGVDGQCGNFNDDPSDDTGELIERRIGYEIPAWESFFETPMSPSGSLNMLNNTQHTVNRAQLQTAASDVVSFFIFADAACRTPFSSHVKLDVTVGPLHCEQGLNFTCSCEGDKKAISGELYEPTCSDRSVVYTIPPFIADGTCALISEEYGLYYKADATVCPECPCDSGQSCTVHGDPHITVFDQAKVALLGIDKAEERELNGESGQLDLDEPSKSPKKSDRYEWGDFWLVKSQQIKVQARYRQVFYPRARQSFNHTYLTALAVGGPFMRNNTLMVRPMESSVLWRFPQARIRQILDRNASIFETQNLVRGLRHDRKPLVPQLEGTVTAVDFELPSGVKLLVDLFNKHLDIRITMLPTAGGAGGVDGQCGNYNGDAFDDTADLIDERVGDEIPAEELLFFHELS
mmetsp:Transcript_35452/g.79973  ORF Transcript_35452/g.79973 Transcript_35452/m.79973 type:complete len:758 (+) Transcript_35452:80-2353(+)